MGPSGFSSTTNCAQASFCLSVLVSLISAHTAARVLRKNQGAIEGGLSIRRVLRDVTSSQGKAPLSSTILASASCFLVQLFARGEGWNA